VENVLASHASALKAHRQSPQTRSELPVALAILQALTMRFERGCMTGQDVLHLRNH